MRKRFTFIEKIVFFTINMYINVAIIVNQITHFLFVILNLSKDENDYSI